MTRTIGAFTLVVRDYDDAIGFYTDQLGFTLVEDTRLTPTKRWVLIAPTTTSETKILLAKADGEAQHMAIGNQSGSRVFMFLHTDDFYRDYKLMSTKGVNFLESPRKESYGIVAVFEDLYGNKWDLIQHYQ